VFEVDHPATQEWKRASLAQTMTAIGEFAAGTDLIAGYMLPVQMRDEAGAIYGTLVAVLFHGTVSSRGRRHPVQPAEVLDLLADQHARVQAPFLGHVAELAAFGLPHHGAVPTDGSGVERGEPEHRSHGGRLARAVRTEEAGHLA
jgi:hypothetical protein